MIKSEILMNDKTKKTMPKAWFLGLYTIF